METDHRKKQRRTVVREGQPALDAKRPGEDSAPTQLPKRPIKKPKKK